MPSRLLTDIAEKIESSFKDNKYEKKCCDAYWILLTPVFWVTKVSLHVSWKFLYVFVAWNPKNYSFFLTALLYTGWTTSYCISIHAVQCEVVHSVYLYVLWFVLNFAASLILLHKYFRYVCTNICTMKSVGKGTTGILYAIVGISWIK